MAGATHATGPAVLTPPPAATPTPAPAAAPPVISPSPGPLRRAGALQQMGVPDSLVGMLDDAQANHRALSQAALENLDDINTQRGEVMSRPLMRPEVPDLPENPEPPPQTMPGNGLRVYAQFLPVLAMLGGALVKRDATAALRTGAAAMRAARANDQTNLELQHQHWEDQITKLTSDREAMLQQYNAALSDTNLDLTQRLAILNALAAQENNQEMRVRVSMGDLQGIASSVNTQMQAVENIRTQARQDSQANEQARHNREIERARVNGGSLGGAEQRGRITMSLPSVLATLATLREIQNDGQPNPLNQHRGADLLSRLGGPIGESMERQMTQDDPRYQRYAQAASTLEQSFVPMFAGSATTESEARRYVRAYTPQPNDTPEVLADKLQNLERLANQAAIIVGQDPPFPDAGYMDPRQASLLTPPINTDTATSAIPGVPQAALDILAQRPETATQFDETFALEPGTAQAWLDAQGQ